MFGVLQITNFGRVPKGLTWRCVTNDEVCDKRRSV